LDAMPAAVGRRTLQTKTPRAGGHGERWQGARSALTAEEEKPEHRGHASRDEPAGHPGEAHVDRHAGEPDLRRVERWPALLRERELRIKQLDLLEDRKSTRLNSSHLVIS